jgi:hypothetical protein
MLHCVTVAARRRDQRHGARRRWRALRRRRDRHRKRPIVGSIVAITGAQQSRRSVSVQMKCRVAAEAREHHGDWRSRRGS